LSVYDKTKKLIINRPLDWVGSNLSKEAKSLVFETDEEGNMKALPVIIIDPTAASPNASAAVHIADPLTPSIQATVQSLSVATPQASTPGLVTQSETMLFNQATSAFEVQKTMTVFSYLAASAAGSTAIRTSAVGKKFRLMGIAIYPAAGLAVAGLEVIKMLDVAADIGLDFQIYLPIAAGIVIQPPIVIMLPGNGYLMAATNTALNVNLSAACTAGAISVTIWGTEE
jgi:hypothetical protein